jgi:type II secretory pathway component HofQ
MDFAAGLALAACGSDGRLGLNCSITHQSVSSNNAPPASTTTIIASAGLPAGGINYSLNIANAFYNRSEVVARPTLVALDRRSSRFFSGQAVVAGLPGGTYGGSSFIEIPTGVELVVVPAFIDPDTILLSVRASRSTFEPQGQTQIGFTNQVLTARNTVTASVLMKLGEILLLSGITERETNRQADQVPLLGELPIGNLLLSKKTSAEAKNSVLILMTPRSAGASASGIPGQGGFPPAEAAAPAARWRLMSEPRD